MPMSYLTTHPSTNSRVPFPNYNLNIRIDTMKFPIFRAVARPVMPDGTPSRVACGNCITFNNCLVRRFIVLNVVHPTIHPNHVTYVIRDITAGRDVYFLVPLRWTMEDSCWKKSCECHVFPLPMVATIDNSLHHSFAFHWMDVLYFLQLDCHKWRIIRINRHHTDEECIACVAHGVNNNGWVNIMVPREWANTTEIVDERW